MEKKLFINVSDEGKFILIKAKGSINSYTYDDFQKQLYDAIEKKSVCIDLSEVDILSSAGLGTIMYAIEKGEEKGFKVFILSPSSVALEAINSTGFKDMFNIVFSLSDVK
ncbi:MAG: STAS domain-containing protein [Spirochaetia bacterium]|nr:STAS domain-containing protein [Spirochaetota bacterium]MCX8096750.1 STAS domain-containing protein [Spirochaetota bacterium]MDW8112144.1 STAS domain-containing protein [Spirochaetia bacterium]